MTASNGIRTENKIKRLAAALALALAAVLGASCLSPARADAAGTSDGNLVIDVPTTVPCALMADGTVVSPSEWKITTSGDAYIAFASASGFPANVEWSAKTTDLAAAQAGSVRVSGTGDAASVAGPSDPAAAALAGTARFEWSFSKLDAGKNADVIGKAASGTAVLGSVAFTFAKVQTAFAVYSADDNSLTFYKRADVPIVGQMFEGKTATEVYEGVEKASHTAADGAPWSGHAADIASVTVADAGVAPVSTAYWFKGASKLGSVSLAGLDTSQTTSMDGMFDGCSSLESLDLSAMSTRRVTSMTAFLGGCDSLAELSLGSEFAWIGNDCYPPTGDWKQGSTGTKYAENQIPANKTDKYTRTKTAFAVYSADDQSLTFYKRPVVPTKGGVFEGKAATAVYMGFETKIYGSSGSVPWAACQNEVKTVAMADEGVAPRSTAMWFSNMTALESADLTKLHTSNVTSMHSMFYDCKALTELSLSSFNTGKVASMYSMFEGCNALTSLDLSSFDTRSVTNMGGMFEGCNALTSLDLSSFDTQNVTSMQYMFKGCSALTTLNVSSFDTSNVTDMGGMFEGCNALTSLVLSHFNTTKVTDMSGMFYDCKALTELSLSSFNTGKVTYMSNMFSNCGSLTALDLSSFNTRNVSSMYAMFSSCKALQKVAFGAGWRWVGANGYLPTPSSAYIAGADGKGYAPKDIPSNKAMTYTAVAPKSAFAVYSADDNSLSFYKHTNAPSAGDQFEGKAATEVYEGVEKASYTAADGAPWSGHAAELASVKVADAGIAPVSTAYWLKGASKLKSVSLAGLDTSQTTCMDGMFQDCSSLESLDLSAMSTRRVTSMTAFLGGCDSLAELSIGSEFAWVGDDCYPPTGDWKQGSTGADYPESGIPANKTDKYTRTKTAFAVYSADDQSLTFYKRPVAPAEGAQFLGKTASKVFTGFETGTYSPSSVPWAAYRSNVKAVTVADDGIAPTSTAYWFYFFTNATSIDLSKLDTGKVASMRSMFDGCTALTGFDLSSFDTNNVTDMNSLFYGCESLTTLDLSSFDTGNVTDMRSLFQDCNALTVLDLSSFDTGNVTNMACIFSECPSLEKISLGTGFKWVGWNCYPRSGNWESSSTGKVYSAREIPSGVADTYVFKPNTKASTAVNAASDPANNDATIAAMTSTGNTQGESAIQEATEGKPTLEEKTSKECDASSELDGVEKDAEAKPAVENEATKEDVTTTEPEGAEKATAVKSRE